MPKVHIQEKHTAAYINLLLSLEKSDKSKLRQRYEKFNDGRELNGRTWVLLTNRKHKALSLTTIDESSKRKMEFKILVYSGLIAGAICHVRANKL